MQPIKQERIQTAGEAGKLDVVSKLVTENETYILRQVRNCSGLTVGSSSAYPGPPERVHYRAGRLCGHGAAEIILRASGTCQLLMKMDDMRGPTRLTAIHSGRVTGRAICHGGQPMRVGVVVPRQRSW